MNISTVLQETKEYKEHYKKALIELKTILTNYENRTPETTRRYYDQIRASMTAKQDELNKARVEIADSIKNLQECEMLLMDMNTLFEKTKVNINRAKMGTMFGLARQKIKENIGDYDVEGNEQVKFVMEQPYDEAAEIRRGGRMTRRSRKKRAMKTRKRQH
jgi:hypothetical protein